MLARSDKKRSLRLTEFWQFLEFRRTPVAYNSLHRFVDRQSPVLSRPADLGTYNFTQALNLLFPRKFRIDSP